MLHEGVEGFPAKRLCQFLGAHRLVAKLKVIEDSLECKGDALGAVVALRRHLVNGLAQLVGKKECLQKGVHVTSRSLVFQSNKAGVLL